MNLSRPRGGLIAAGFLALAAGAALPAFDAQAQRGRHGDDRAHHRDGTRGTITLGGRHGAFWFHDDPCHSLVSYFSDCGYDAWVDEGRVFVRCDRGRVRLSVRASGYSFTVRYVDDCVIITPRCHAPAVVKVERRVYPSTHITWSSGRWCPPPPPPRCRPAIRGPRWGITFRTGPSYGGRHWGYDRDHRRGHHRERRSRRCR